ncbi:BA14K family protein [Rhizobium jaguaris]|uniref:Lectin-like protein BA14k n=1 Tax=Rhizobium jaguaris TaxID=1312183 RepID=A0A387FZP1_9HYPH|nr:BA14K family protein [Rhizobium jaguaris]AYG61604.1 BA14K family protein [Rhizobium jaguaris]
MNRLAIIALSCVTALTGVVTPAEAFPTTGPLKITTSDVQTVQYMGDRGNMRGQWNRPYWRRGYGGYYGHGGYYRHGGYYGHGYYHDHYHDDAGAIIGGLAAGAIIGGIIASQRGYYSGGGHTSWCYQRYRSYRAYDNTYQPYNGPRRQCYSPY